MERADNHVSVDQLRQLIVYNPETGKMYWLHRGVEWFENSGARTAQQVCDTWNARYAFEEAFASPNSFGHLTGSVLGRYTLGHRVAWAMHHGAWPSGRIDHINGDPADNSIKNLRLATPEDNARNASRSRRNKSGVTGVRWYAQSGKWHVQISKNHRNHHIGFFNDFNEAVAARKQAELDFGYHPNHGRAPHHREA
jgi:hypothetical protein